MGKAMTQEEFIAKAKLYHGDKFNYSLVKYKGVKFKVQIICPVHGKFWQKAGNHLRGNDCNKCSMHLKQISISAGFKERSE